ncbi:MAG: tripartite tricarboxylate transporter TctB family protein [bacterium]
MKADRYIGLILIVFSVFMYLQTFKFPPAMLGTLGAGFFPKILFTLLGLAGIGLIISSFIQNKERPLEKTFSLKVALQTHSLVILSFVLIFIYIVAMPYFGFLWATLGFMISLMWLLGPRKIKNLPLIIIISCGLTFVIYFSFLKLLQIFLPEGVVF